MANQVRATAESSAHSPATREREGAVVSSRKDHHLDVVLQRDVGSRGPAVGLGRYTLEYDALPELDLESIDLGTTLLGKALRAPIIVGAMTGGSDRAALVNQRLAKAAAKVGIGMALGSQRAMLLKPELTRSFAVREDAPALPLLFGNVGAVQLNYGVGAPEIEKMVRSVGADALNFHLNPLQEAIQPEGDTRFAGLAAKLRETVAALPFPCFVKEVGSGISERTANKLATLGLAGVEVAGVGGTSWAHVEAHRAAPTSVHAEVGRRLAGFGVDTASSLSITRRVLGDRGLVIASGGIRSGMDVAVALALGADAVALAAPLLGPAHESDEAVVRALDTILYELRVICFCTGARTVSDLKNVRVLDAAGVA
ncbi:MAG: type 2 isopentenyl-diphosphate Delta-isomerase [Sandaracinus sp.]